MFNAIERKSLYMIPQYTAKNPINAIKYLYGRIILNMKFCILFTSSNFHINHKPNASNIAPCPISPNITPNKKGKVIVVKIDGFISLYRGTP